MARLSRVHACRSPRWRRGLLERRSLYPHQILVAALVSVGVRRGPHDLPRRGSCLEVKQVPLLCGHGAVFLVRFHASPGLGASLQLLQFHLSIGVVVLILLVGEEYLVLCVLWWSYLLLLRALLTFAHIHKLGEQLDIALEGHVVRSRLRIHRPFTQRQLLQVDLSGGRRSWRKSGFLSRRPLSGSFVITSR